MFKFFDWHLNSSTEFVSINSMLYIQSDLKHVLQLPKFYLSLQLTVKKNSMIRLTNPSWIFFSKYQYDLLLLY